MEHAETFGGLKVIDWQPGQALNESSAHAYRISCDYDSEESWEEMFSAFLEMPGVEQVKAFVVGPWGEVASGDAADGAVEALVSARAQLKNLEALFFGDIIAEESEISWINQTDLSPLLSAYPRLTELRVRGGQDLSLGTLKHALLQSLIVETGGLDRSVVEQVSRADLPALVHLELWLGDDSYGANTSPEDFAVILSGKLFPKLETLALRNCHYADELATAVASSKVLERIRVLDLSLGTLSDEGGEALLASSTIKKLKRLDLHHHYLSEEMQGRFRQLGIDVNLDDPCEAEDDDDGSYRYVAVSE